MKNKKTYISISIVFALLVLSLIYLTFINKEKEPEFCLVVQPTYLLNCTYNNSTIIAKAETEEALNNAINKQNHASLSKLKYKQKLYPK